MEQEKTLICNPESKQDIMKWNHVFPKKCFFSGNSLHFQYSAVVQPKACPLEPILHSNHRPFQQTGSNNFPVAEDRYDHLSVQVTLFYRDQEFPTVFL